MKTLGESKSFCTCPPSGNQVDGLPLAPRLCVCVWVYIYNVSAAIGGIMLFIFSNGVYN
jgi:hypothetical protein